MKDYHHKKQGLKNINESSPMVVKLEADNLQSIDEKLLWSEKRDALTLNWKYRSCVPG